MLRRIKISGHSLSPEFEEGDFVVTVKIPLFLHCLRRGDTVVFTQPPYGMLIKRVEWVNIPQDQVFVVGSHAHSVDSRQFGPVSGSSLLGKVLWHIRRPRNHAD